MASIVQRDNSYSVVYYKKENGIRKQKWESFRTIKDALHRKSMVEYSQQSKKELAHRPQTVEQLIQEYVWLYGRAKWSLSMYTSTQGLIRNYINPYFGSVRLDELTPRLVSRLYMEFQQEPRYCGPYHKYEGQSVSASTLKAYINCYIALLNKLSCGNMWIATPFIKERSLKPNQHHQYSYPQSRSNSSCVIAACRGCG